MLTLHGHWVLVARLVLRGDQEGLGRHTFVVSSPGQAGDRLHVALPFQWVLAFEIFIPLVLFFILLGLRQKKPTISVKEGEVQA